MIIVVTLPFKRNHDYCHQSALSAGSTAWSADLIRMGTDRSARVSRRALWCHERFSHPARPVFPTDTLCASCSLPQKRSFPQWLCFVDMTHLRAIIPL